MKTTIELVKINGEVFATSKQVAEDFGKQHKHVLEAINKMLKDEPNYRPMFIETTKRDKYGREQPAYNLTKDGFTLLAFGFTGKKAMQFKLDYIKAFKDMEAQLKELDTVKATAPEFDWAYFDVKFDNAFRIKRYFKDESDDLTQAYANFTKWSRKRLDVKKRVKMLNHILEAIDMKCRENGSINNGNYYTLREEVVALSQQILRDIDSTNNRSYGKKLGNAKKIS